MMIRQQVLQPLAEQHTAKEATERNRADLQAAHFNSRKILVFSLRKISC
jgi:hypothetical protein